MTLPPHPVRDQIVDAMRNHGRPISPGELARIVSGSAGSVAYHMRALAAADVVKLVPADRMRGVVEHFYVLTMGKDDVLYDPARMLLVLCGALTVAGEDGSYPQPVRLDGRAREDLDRLIARVRSEVLAIATASTARTAV
jgi:hypothetical protein